MKKTRKKKPRKLERVSGLLWNFSTVLLTRVSRDILVAAMDYEQNGTAMDHPRNRKNLEHLVDLTWANAMQRHIVSRAAREAVQEAAGGHRS
ncbi:MAG: hypothetical protein M3O22_08275 [Pseudomonadota bacterium]|nr:hypothetical protein [Pseudomonadota bacterium]